MKRRLYFILPDEAHALRLVGELEAAGIARRHMHAIPGRGANAERLPVATAHQRRDTAGLLERWIWIGNLGLFALAMAGFAWAAVAGHAVAAAAGVAVALASLAGGVLFAMRVPYVHLDEFRGVLAHREILLMVDVARRRVAEIESLVERRHPEAVAGGTSWTIERLGI
jgi:hypothetical protein